MDVAKSHFGYFGTPAVADVVVSGCRAPLSRPALEAGEKRGHAKPTRVAAQLAPRRMPSPDRAAIGTRKGASC